MAIVISNIIADPFAISTLSIASLAWLITFIGAIASSVESSFPTYSWWGIMWQLITNVSICVLYLTDTIEFYRTLIVGMLSIAFIYTTNSSNNLVYSTNSAKAAGAAGSILLSMINVIWLLYFGGDPSSPTSQWIDSFSTSTRGSLQHQQAQQQYRQQQQKMMTENSAGAGGVGVGATGANPFGYSSAAAAHNRPYMASSTQLNGLENGEEPIGQGYYSSTAAAINNSNNLSDDDEEDDDEDIVDIGGSGAGAGAGTGAGVAGVGAATAANAGGADSYPYTVKALYDYDANPADATELSFAKGEILQVQSIDGRWWQAKNAQGKIGILPSNYVEKIDG